MISGYCAYETDSELAEMEDDVFGALTLQILCVDYRILHGDLRWIEEDDTYRVFNLFASETYLRSSLSSLFWFSFFQGGLFFRLC